MTDKSKERALWKLLRLDNTFKAGFLSVHTNLVGLEFDAFLCVSGMEKVSSMFQMIAWQVYFKAWHWQIFTLWWRKKRGEEVQKYLDWKCHFFFLYVDLSSHFQGKQKISPYLIFPFQNLKNFFKIYRENNVISTKTFFTHLYSR